MGYAKPYEWKKQSKIKMDLEDYICEDCGKKAVHVHHIDKEKHNHDLSNLKSLCKKCHDKYHPKEIGRKYNTDNKKNNVTSTSSGFDMHLGMQLMIARLDKDVTQEEVFEETGINIATISNIENGKSDPKQSTLEKLSKFYGYKLQLVK